jgi:hypothetical protein
MTKLNQLLFKFNSIRVYLRANLTAQRSITKLERVHRKSGVNTNNNNNNNNSSTNNDSKMINPLISLTIVIRALIVILTTMMTIMTINQ